MAAFVCPRTCTNATNSTTHARNLHSTALKPLASRFVRMLTRGSQHNTCPTLRAFMPMRLRLRASIPVCRPRRPRCRCASRVPAHGCKSSCQEHVAHLWHTASAYSSTPLVRHVPLAGVAQVRGNRALVGWRTCLRCAAVCVCASPDGCAIDTNAVRGGVNGYARACRSSVCARRSWCTQWASMS
jgi:hypothetical protein